MAMFENSEALDREIERLAKRLTTLDPTKDEYKAVRINLDTLYKLRNDQYKVDTEDLEKRDKSEAELKQQAAELEVRKQELEAARKRYEDESKQKAEELDLKRRELDFAEKRLEAETLQKNEENDIRTYELQLSETQHDDNIKSQKAERRRDYIVTGINAVVGILKLGAVIGFALITTDRGYKFEETGTSTSQTFREAKKTALDMVKDLFKTKG